MIETIYKGTFLKRSVPFLVLAFMACQDRNKKISLSGGQPPLQKRTSMETINMAVGDSTHLRFRSLATAGYLWQYEQEPAGIITISKEGTTEPAQATPGQSRDEIFKIMAIATGRVHLVFKQQRSWQKETSPHAVKDYMVEVK